MCSGAGRADASVAEKMRVNRKLSGKKMAARNYRATIAMVTSVTAQRTWTRSCGPTSPGCAGDRADAIELDRPLLERCSRS